MKNDDTACSHSHLDTISYVKLAFSLPTKCHFCGMRIGVKPVQHMLFSMFATFLTVILIVSLGNVIGFWGIVAAFVIVIIVNVLAIRILPLETRV